MREEEKTLSKPAAPLRKGETFNKQSRYRRPPSPPPAHPGKCNRLRTNEMEKKGFRAGRKGNGMFHRGRFPVKRLTSRGESRPASGRAGFGSLVKAYLSLSPRQTDRRTEPTHWRIEGTFQPSFYSLFLPQYLMKQFKKRKKLDSYHL